MTDIAYLRHVHRVFDIFKGDWQWHKWKYHSSLLGVCSGDFSTSCNCNSL